MDYKSIALELKDEFSTFREAYPSQRKQRLSHLEYLCSQARSAEHSAYLGGKCTAFLECCRQMARLRQPRTYDESQVVSHALGDLNMIETLLLASGSDA